MVAVEEKQLLEQSTMADPARGTLAHTPEVPEVVNVAGPAQVVLLLQIWRVNAVPLQVTRPLPESPLLTQVPLVKSESPTVDPEQSWDVYTFR